MPVPLPPGLEPGLSDEAFFEPANNTYPFGCHISMLEIDRETGEPKLLKLVAVDDAGNLINPLIVEGQIHGGLAQGIGQAMIEEAVYNEDGQLLTGSFMDYAMPRATDFPRFELHATVTPTPVQSARRQGRRRGRHARLDAVHRHRGGRRAERVRREAHRHDAAARKAVAHHPGRPAHDSDSIRLRTRHVARRCAGEAGGVDGGGKLIAGGHSLVPLMKLRLSEPRRADRHRADPRPVRHPRAGRHASRSAPRTVHHDVATSTLLRDKCPMLAEAAAEIGDPQVRNRGTHRRQPRARRSVGRLSGGDARARRGDPR